MKIHKLHKKFLSRFGPADPVHVFHHIPKCGGTSVRSALSKWFIRKNDYRKGWTEDYPDKQDLNRLRSVHCLCGHFELDGYRLRERYPEVFISQRYRVFTMVRDPFELRKSLFSYLLKNGQAGDLSFESHLLAECNYLSKCLDVDESNYRQRLDEYFFIGLIEEGQKSMDLLATLLGKRKVELPKLNEAGAQPMDRIQFSSSALKEFKDSNQLDYKVYAYCYERFSESNSSSLGGKI